MPQAPKHPCAHPSCGALTNGRYCPAHHQDKSNYRHTKTAAQRGYGTAWRKLRLIVLRRDNGLCQYCLKEGRVKQAQVIDHIKPKCAGGTDDIDNLQSLCHKCHNRKTSTEDSKGGGFNL